LDTIGLKDVKIPETEGLAARDKQYDLLAAHFEKHINTDFIFKLKEM